MCMQLVPFLLLNLTTSASSSRGSALQARPFVTEADP